jgi:hypothetical protein
MNILLDSQMTALPAEGLCQTNLRRRRHESLQLDEDIRLRQRCNINISHKSPDVPDMEESLQNTIQITQQLFIIRKPRKRSSLLTHW